MTNSSTGTEGDSAAQRREATREEIRQSIRKLCERFPETYWQKLDKDRRYPEEFVAALTEGGWLAILVPEKYGGAGLGFYEATAVLQEIHRAGAYAAPIHAQMYTMGALLRHGSEEQKQKWLPEIAKGKLRLQAFAITEPTAGSDTTSITTRAERDGDHYVIHGQKTFTSRVQHSDLMMILARTTPRDKVEKKVDGMTLMIADMREESVKSHLEVKPIETMINHETNQVFFDGLEVPVGNRIGEEGKGFRYVLSGMNAERLLIASECIGDGRYFIDKSVEYAKTRVVFGRPIGQNQGIQFPIAKASMLVESAAMVCDHSALLFDAGKEGGKEANMAKYLASEASWEAANVAMSTFGGYGMTTAMNIERKFRETKLMIVAPVSNNLVLSYMAEHYLGLPRSF